MTTPMTIDRAREIVSSLAAGEERHPPFLQKEINRAFAVCIEQAVMIPVADVDIARAAAHALERRDWRVGIADHNVNEGQEAR